MIERVARAIDPENYAIWDKAFVEKDVVRMRLTRYKLDDAVKQARAAIEAMREPTDEMLEADGADPFAYQTMIDAALEEGK